jgi:hypothetical protein
LDYLPEDVELTDPSKIHRDITESIMQHWWNRQEDGTEDVTFCFKAFEQKDSTGMMIMEDARLPSDAQRPSAKAKALSNERSKRKAQKSKTKQRKGPMNTLEDSSMEDDIAEKLKELDRQPDGNDDDSDDDHPNSPVSVFRHEHMQRLKLIGTRW